MIDVQDVEAERALGGQCREGVEERDGIGAPGDGDEHDVAVAEHLVATNGGADGLEEVETRLLTVIQRSLPG